MKPKQVLARLFMSAIILVLLCGWGSVIAWQQAVVYTIRVSLDTHEEKLTGHEILMYTNNSPDTLYEVHFHLYQNAFQPGSYLDNKFRSRHNYTLADLNGEDRGWIQISHLRNGSGDLLAQETDNTIMRVPLNRPLPPGEQAAFEMDFVTKIGKRAWRINAQGGQFVISQWYPKICVYDDCGGWHTDQHFGHEFYGEFGSFDVEITVPSDFIVGATGVLINRADVLPDTLMEKLDIKNYGGTPEYLWPKINLRGDTTKTWIFRAENVHDFAWCADRTFRIGTAEWEGVHIYTLVRERKAHTWHDAAEATRNAIRLFSENFGTYPYPQMTVADVDQGMEYPMIVMCGGTSPSYQYLFYHEIGHNWFYGAVGSNETAYPCLDEGFTTYLTAFALDSLVEEYENLDWPDLKTWYERTFYQKRNMRLSRYHKYLTLAKTGYEEKVLIHSDQTRERLTYRNSAYNKPAITLYMLEYVLGDDVFNEVVRTYYERYTFHHPYPDDFMAIAEEISGRPLHWFFEQWWNTTKTCDYAVASLKNKKLSSGQYEVNIGLRRCGEIIMPIDLVLTLADGTRQKLIIPIDQFSKQEEGAIVLEPWYGWDEFNRMYTASVSLPTKAISAEIDPSLRLAETSRLNNRSGLLPKLDVRLDNLYVDYPTWDAYHITFRPSFAYNDVDGLKSGLICEGSYMKTEYSADHHFRGGLWIGPMSGEFDYNIHYTTPVRHFGRLTNFILKGSRIEGRSEIALGFSDVYRRMLGGFPYTTLDLTAQRMELHDASYLISPWDDGVVTTVEAQFGHHTRTRRVHTHLCASFVTNTFKSDYDFSRVDVAVVKNFNLGRSWHMNSRFYWGHGEGDVPMQRQFYLTGANPAEEYDAQFYRSKGGLPNVWRKDGHLHKGGGGNMRGYLEQNEIGNRILAFNLELNFPKILRRPLATLPLIGKHLSTIENYAFFDMGDIRQKDYTFTFQHDAGLGFLWTVPKIPPRLGKYIIRADFPVYVSHPLPDEDELEFRWLVALGHAF
ncbi:MAG: M1 family metallopeptidase [Gemmatimonadota bacterium]|nr:MAG: M1 family metallopeptidase [Gemmatimonadota bacterium]